MEARGTQLQQESHAGLCVCVKLLQLCPTHRNPMDCSLPGPLSVGFSRQEHWSGLLCPAPGDLPGPGMEATSLVCLLHWQVGSLLLVPPDLWVIE